MNTLPESSPEIIDIQRLAQELGVEDMYYTYPDEDIKKAGAVFEYFCQNIQRDEEGYVSIKAEATMQISGLFGDIKNIPYVPLFFPRLEHVDEWKKTLFFNVLIVFIICRGMELRINAIRDLQEKNIFLSAPESVIAKLNDVEIFNTFGALFLQRVKVYLHQQPIFHHLKEQLLPLEVWYDSQLAEAARIGAPKKKLIKYDKSFWSDKELTVAKFFIENSAISAMNPKEFIEYIDRFLCHGNNEYFDLLVSSIGSKKSGFLKRWHAWIYQRKDLFLDNDMNETQKIFGRIFGLKDKIIVNNEVSQESQQKLPEELLSAFNGITIQSRRIQKKMQKKALKNIPNSSSTTAISVLASRPVPPKKEEILLPNVRAFFVQGEKKQQLVALDLSSMQFPEGTKILFERQVPGDKTFHVLADIAENGQTIIPPVQGEKYRGHFTYRLTVTLPSTHIFPGGKSTMYFTEKMYAEAELTEDEKREHKERIARHLEQQKESQIDGEKSNTGKGVIDTTSAKVESIIDPKTASLLAVACILLEKAEQYKSDNAYTGGAVVIKISEQDAREVLGDEAHTLIDGHREWTIQEDDAISPDPDADVRAGLLSIAHSLREKAQTMLQQQEEQIQREQIDQEYREARKEFAPLFDFIRGFRFEGREGDLEKQRDTLREQLKMYGWSIPGSFAGGVIWRHMTGYIRILYPTKQCNSCSIEAESRGVLTPALQKCYAEVAEAGAHIARFFNAENRDRTRMIRRERAMTKEIQTGAEAYDKLLDKGQARLVLFGTYQQSHGLWSSKFPTEERPFMLDERVSHETIGSILAQNPGAELCYRRDQLCLNGEIGEDAGEESVENTLQNITELRNSPRARYILRKRILITLGLERFSGDTARAPIKHEKGKKEHSHSALDILQYLSLMWCRAKDILNTCDTSDICQHIRQEGYGYDMFDHSSFDEKKSAGVFYQMRHIFEENTTVTLSANDIDKNFIDAYIDCLELLKIRVHYVWPISVHSDEHQKLVKKAQ